MLHPRLSRTGFLLGAAGALLASVVTLVVGRLWSAPVIPQLLSDRLTAIIPLEVFGQVLGSLESAAKPLALAGIVAGTVLVGGLVAALLAGRGRAPGFLGLLVGTWGLLALVAAPLGGIGLLGLDAPAGPWRAALAFLAPALTYAAVVSGGLDWLAAGERVDPERRRVLQTTAYGLVAVLALGYLGRFLLRLGEKSQPAPTPDTADGLPPALTPTKDFYVVSKNFVDPSVAVGGWSLEVRGLVERPARYSYDQVRARPAFTKITTLECISNEVGGDYISTGEWTGFPLGDLLSEAGVKPGAVDVVLHAADGYTDSIPIAKALHPDTILVYDLNGTPLPEEHGFPLRLIVPGIFGMKNVKWITAIEVAGQDVRGYWQERGWSDVATVQTMSRFYSPRRGTRIVAGQPTTLGGVAFAGDRGISRVEVSTDGGHAWQAATLEPPLSPLTWVRWTYRWVPPAPGHYTLAVRAADGTGALQTSEEQDPLPDGATGYHRIRVTVERGAA